MSLNMKAIKQHEQAISETADLDSLAAAVDRATDLALGDREGRQTEWAVDSWLDVATRRAAELARGLDGAADLAADKLEESVQSGMEALVRASGAARSLESASEVWSAAPMPMSLQEDMRDALETARATLTTAERMSVVAGKTLENRLKDIASELAVSSRHVPNIDRQVCDTLGEVLAATARCHRENVEGHRRVPLVNAAAASCPELAASLHQLFSAHPEAEDMRAVARTAYLDRRGVSEKVFGMGPDHVSAPGA